MYDYTHKENYSAIEKGKHLEASKDTSSKEDMKDRPAAKVVNMAGS